jgi:predicted amidophosphoribosyltransferase
MKPDIIEDLLALSFIYQAESKNECSVCGSDLDPDGTCPVCLDENDSYGEDSEDDD